MPALPRSSLVGLALDWAPGRGEPGTRVGVARAEGPMDWRALTLPFSLGPGEGLGLVEGGRRLICEEKEKKSRELETLE